MLAKDGQWAAAVRPVMDQCDQQGVAMVAAHERTYGPGTGIAFLRGPYLKDLPRALATRLQSDFNRIDQEEADARRVQAEQEARAKDVQAEREKLVDTAAKDYLACLQAQVLEIVPYSDESATVIVDVVFRKCASLEDKLRTVMVVASGESKSSVDLEFGKIKDTTQRDLIANIVAARAKAEREKREKLEAPSSSPPAVHRL